MSTTPSLPLPVAAVSIPNNQFTFKPNYAGSDPNIFTTWTALYAKHQTVEGHKVIIFDNDLGGTLIIPPGVYDMRETDWVSCKSSFTNVGMFAPRINVIILDGVVFSYPMCMIDGLMAIEYQGTSGPAMVIDLDNNEYDRGFWLDSGAAIVCSGTEPFLHVTATTPGQLFIFVLKFGGGIYNLGGGNPVLSSDTNVIFIINVVGTNVILTDDTLMGAGYFGFISASADFQKSQDVLFTMPTVQPAVTGTIQYQDKLFASPKVYQKSGAPTAGDDMTLYYKTGDQWIDLTMNKFYICVDPNAGAALWNGPY